MSAIPHGGDAPGPPSGDAASPPTTPAAGNPPPGWYPDPTGQLRWWDGWAWGPAAPMPGAVGGSDPRTMGMLAHLLGIFTGFLGPLILYLTTGKQDPYVRHHSAEALNFQLTFLIVWVACIALACLIIGLFALPVVWIASLVFEIQGCLAANRGEWWRYPINIRMVSGAVG